MFEINRGKHVFVAGHMVFGGSWLCEMLLLSGVKVYGYALRPSTKPALFDQLRLKERLCGHEIGDIRDRRRFGAVRSDFGFHLAAQPLVRLSYEQPDETFETNVMRTVNLLKVVRSLKKPCRVVCITTEKIYENGN